MSESHAARYSGLVECFDVRIMIRSILSSNFMPYSIYLQRIHEPIIASYTPGLVLRCTSCIFQQSMQSWSVLYWPSLLQSISYLAYNVPSKVSLKTGLKLPSWYGVQIKRHTLQLLIHNCRLYYPLLIDNLHQIHLRTHCRILCMHFLYHH